MVTQSVLAGRPRLDLALRILAVPAAYPATAFATIALARHLPLPDDQATVAATLASFAIFALIVLTAFGAQKVGQVWLGLILATGLLAALAWPWTAAP